MHFWVNHRLLHTRPLRRFHLPHHRSVVTTPFSTYSFHPIEALMLGNVIMLPMMLHDFSFWSLASVPLFSLFFNCIGHANYDFFPKVSYAHWFAASRRHHLHHACYNGNYGFQFTFMDRLFRTRLKADAAERAAAGSPEASRLADARSRRFRCPRCATGATGEPGLSGGVACAGGLAMGPRLLVAAVCADAVSHAGHRRDPPQPTHLRMWRGRWANRATDFWITLLQGHPTFVFYPAHVANHHR